MKSMNSACGGTEKEYEEINRIISSLHVNDGIQTYTQENAFIQKKLEISGFIPLFSHRNFHNKDLLTKGGLS